MKISEILWKAANECLSDLIDSRGQVYSCNAVAAVLGKGIADECQNHPAMKFLRILGCNTRGAQWHEWTHDEQQARYAWLMFASMYAEELGL